ncbi:antibiotic biosynthesis monooxygenase [Streptomyces sp. NPDC020096]
MIIIHVEYGYRPDGHERMRRFVPDVEKFCRAFDGCESFTLSFPAQRDDVLLGTEVWRDAAAVRAHLKVAHDAPELADWHGLITTMDAHFFDGSTLTIEELRADPPEGAVS